MIPERIPVVQHNRKQDVDGSADARRGFLGAALLGMAGGAWSTLKPVSALAADSDDQPARVGLYPEDAPPADIGYSPGISTQAGKLIFVSGQGPADLDADMETQIRQTFQRIGQVLAEAGASFEHIAMLRSYFVNIQRDLPIYRKVRRDYLVKPYPASTAVGVPALAIDGLMIEIEAVAVL
jgi:enamine deaminase RidA (YjgF/YER057c/UK114 family)